MAELAIPSIKIGLSLVDEIIRLTDNGVNLYRNFVVEIGEVKEQLKLMQGRVKEGQEQEALEKNLRMVGYHIEHVLDRMTMLHEPHDSPTNKAYQLGHSIWPWSPTRGIQEEIQQIQKRMKSIQQTLLVPQPQNQRPRTKLPHHISETPKDAVILGIEPEGLKQNLMSQLINTRDRNLRAVVVAGPPGSGKTVLVNCVYTADEVSRHFSCSLRARLSRHFDVDAVLSLLLSQTLQCRGKKTVPTGNFAIDLKNNLQGKRYLVILDDVWCGKDWTEIMHALPDDSNASRVVVTTTKGDVAYSINASGSHTHKIEGLKDEDSWELFCTKAFAADKGTCPSDLEVSSRKIMRKCEGSPLAISAVGDFLAKEKRLPAEWAELAENLRAEMENNPQFSDLNNSIQQSYDDLNANLKSCLLYFSLFPEGCDIERERLIRLWVAERFVNQTGEKPAEKVAVEYLKELIRRNLVVAKEDFDGCVKSCQVNNFLRYFLTIQSKKEDFAHVFDKPEVKAGEDARRLLITGAFCSGREKVKGKFCTSILFGGVSLPHVKEICSQFKFLKVLDFQGAPLQNFPECVVDLGLLRYLSLRDSKDIFNVPSSIKKLRYLEFLDLKNTSVTCLPKEICLLHKLQHLLVYSDPKSTYDTFQGVQGMQMTGEIKSLSSLRKLTLLKAENHLGQLGNLWHLQKLGLIELRSSDGQALFDSLANMKNLSVLDLRSVNERENLHLDYKLLHSNNLKRVYLKGPLEKLPGWLTSLTSLVRLHLKWSGLTSSSINKLQGLNALTELHLVDAFAGNKLEFKSNMFVKLKVLRIENFAELTTLEVSKRSMCKLEKLTLCKCKQLKTVRMHHISELKELELFDMPEELTNRLRRSGLDHSRIKVHNSSSDAANLTEPEQNGMLHDLVLPLVQSLKDFTSRFR